MTSRIKVEADSQAGTVLGIDVDEFCAVYKRTVPAEVLLGKDMVLYGKRLGDFGCEVSHPGGRLTLMVHSKARTHQGLGIFKCLEHAYDSCCGSDTDGCIILADRLFLHGRGKAGNTAVARSRTCSRWTSKAEVKRPAAAVAHVVRKSERTLRRPASARG